MKIALIGYGKMGHAIERIALSRGHQIVSRIDADNQADFESPDFASADVAIEFTTPRTAVDNYRRAFARGVKVVSGTTGWLQQAPEMRQLCDEGKGTLLWSSNFSIGVNIFFAVNSYLASIMKSVPQYKPSMTEVHHIHKLDHPSGTAITLAEGIIKADPAVTGWTEQLPAPDGVMPIESVREGEVPGIHRIVWTGDADTITIEHSARNRDGFALGAVLAAEWTASRSGWLTMDEFMRGLITPEQN